MRKSNEIRFFSSQYDIFLKISDLRKANNSKILMTFTFDLRSSQVIYLNCLNKINEKKILIIVYLRKQKIFFFLGGSLNLTYDLQIYSRFSI